MVPSSHHGPRERIFFSPIFVPISIYFVFGFSLVTICVPKCHREYVWACLPRVCIPAPHSGLRSKNRCELGRCVNTGGGRGLDPEECLRNMGPCLLSSPSSSSSSLSLSSISSPSFSSSSSSSSWRFQVLQREGAKIGCGLGWVTVGLGWVCEG